LTGSFKASFPDMPTVVDIHSHLYPTWFVDYFRTRSEVPRVVEDDDGDRFLLFTTEDGAASGPLLTQNYTSVDAKLDFMEQYGIDRSLVSVGNPWLEVFDKEESVAFARDANARMGSLLEETSGRLIGMGVLPRADPESLTSVVEEVAAHPGLRGVITSTTPGGFLLDDRQLDPFWQALASTRTPLMIHPMMACVPREQHGYGIAISVGVGFPFRTTIALARLLLGGVLERHDGLRLVAAHGGGALPFLIGRLEETHFSDSEGPSLGESAKNLLFDAALYEAESVRLAADLVGSDRLLFGTDHPFPNADVPRIREAIQSGVPVSDVEEVMGAAATRWFDLS
jgi:aminocarboxymuconate-semialdehyde decarboxylase